MTDKQKYLSACRFAIHQLMKKGSIAALLNCQDNEPIEIRWKDTLDWIDKEYEILDQPSITARWTRELRGPGQEHSPVVTCSACHTSSIVRFPHCPYCNAKMENPGLSRDKW